MVEIIKTKTTIFKVTQIGLEFLPYDNSFRAMRKGSKQCFSCEKDFENGEMMSLAIMKNTTNKLMCRQCAEQIKSKLEEK